MKEFLEKIHTRQFRWTDFFVIGMISTTLIVMGGEIVGEVIVRAGKAVLGIAEDGYSTLLSMYLAFIGIWIICLLVMAAFRRNRPMLKAVWTAPKGNRVSYLFLGLLIGFLMNGSIILLAWLNKDIKLSFDRIDLLQLLIMLVAVFIQSSAEELCTRIYLFQRIRRGYKGYWFAIVINAALFGLLHVFNPGVTALPIIEIILTGILYSLMMIYFDSPWLVMGAHAGWNYTQNIIFGLPNSGIVSLYSIFKLDAATGTSSFAYDPQFGIEGSIASFILHVALVVLMIYLCTRKKARKPYDPWLELETAPAN